MKLVNDAYKILFHCTNEAELILYTGKEGGIKAGNGLEISEFTSFLIVHN